jgi:hypothetical protein
VCGARGVVVLEYPVNGLQNGDPDGIALVDAGGQLVEFLSYGGAFTAVGGPAGGVPSADIGVKESTSTPAGQSLSRNGSDVWSGPAADTFGGCNDDGGPVPAAVARVTVAPETATIAPRATQRFAASAFDAAGQPVPGATITWTSTAPTVATVDAAGTAAGVAVGSTAIIATAPSGVADTAELRVTEAPPATIPAIRFSEIHYDNTGEDAGEAIEVEGPAGADLTGWSVVLYNQTGGAAYNTRALAGTVPALCSGRGVVVLNYPTAQGIQNGPADGFALVDASGGVVEFLSYEGALTASDGPAAGLTATDVGVDEDPAPAAGQSLQRDSLGAWRGPAPASFGACNTGGGSTPGTRGLVFTGRAPSDVALPVGFQDQLFASLRESGSTIPTTVTWSSDTPGLAAIDANGVVTALGAGTAVLRATAADGTTGTTALPIRVAAGSATASYGNHAEFGEPADADPSDDYIVRKARFVTSWNGGRGTPNWVSYNLEASHFGARTAATASPSTRRSRRASRATRRPTTPARRRSTATHRPRPPGALVRPHGRSLDNAETFYFTNIIPKRPTTIKDPGRRSRPPRRPRAAAEPRGVHRRGRRRQPRHGEERGEDHDPRRRLEGRRDPAARPGARRRGRRPRPRGRGGEHAQRRRHPDVRWEAYRVTVDSVEALSGYDLLALCLTRSRRPSSAAQRRAGDHRVPPRPGRGPAPAGREGVRGPLHRVRPVQRRRPDGAGDGPFATALDWGDGTAWTPNAVPADTPLVAPHDYTAPGAYVVRLTVTDRRGASRTATLPVRVVP